MDKLRDAQLTIALSAAAANMNKETIAAQQAEMRRLERRIVVLTEALNECEGYFADKADLDSREARIWSEIQHAKYGPTGGAIGP